MVTLSTAYGLCSLTDQTGFIHVNNDELGCAVVTLGKNIAIRYRLSDQKQLNSWSTIPPFTSQVVYDPESSEYIAIFSENNVKRWKVADTNLDKLPKIKLKDPGNCVLLDDGPLVLFKSGACCRLSYVANKNHTPLKGFLADGAKIEAVKTFAVGDQKYLSIVACVGDRKYVCHCVKLIGEHLLPDLSSLKTLKLRRPGQHVVSFCYTTRESGEFLVTLWSDAFIYFLPIPWPDDSSIGQFSGVVRAVTCGSGSAMTALSANHIAIYGGDPAEEGAVLAVYNLDFGMIQASTKFKILHKPAKVWSAHDRLLVGFGQRLLCVPFTLETGCVSAIVGSRPLATNTSSSDIIAVVPTLDWEPSKEIEKKSKKLPAELSHDIDVFASQGLSESGIGEALISQYLEKEDIAKLYVCLDHFLDIPERLVVSLLHFAFSCPASKLQTLPKSPEEPRTPLVNGVKSKKKRKSDLKNHTPLENGFTTDKADCNGASSTETCPLSPVERAHFVDRVLQVPRNKSALVSALRTGFSNSDCLNMLQYLSYMLVANKLPVNCIDWVTSLIDAFYQQLLLGRNTECVDAVLRLKESVANHMATLHELREVLPNVVRLRSKKQSTRNALQLKSYSIQKIKIYQ